MADVGTVAVHGLREILNRHIRIGEQSLLTQHDGDEMHQFVGLFCRLRFVMLLRFYCLYRLLGQNSISRYVAQAEQKDGH